MFYGLDVHKEFIQVCQLDAKGANRKDYRIGGSAEEIDHWAQGLGRRDQVVLETTFTLGPSTPLSPSMRAGSWWPTPCR